MGDTLSGLFGDVSGLANTAGSDIGSFFGGIGTDLSGLFGGSPAPSLAGAAPVTGVTPPAPAVTPDVSAVTPSSVSSAAAVANPLPNAGDLSPPIVFGGGVPNASSAATFGGDGGAAPLASSPVINPATNTPAGPFNPMTANPPASPTPLDLGGGTLAPPIGSPTSGGSPNVLSQIFSPGNSSLLKTLLSGGALGLDIARASQQPPGVAQLQGLAGQQAALAKSYGAQAEGESEGILPAGATALIQNNLDAQVAAIKSNYAKMGMSGSSAETADLNAAMQEALASTFQIGQTMAQQGLQEVQSASGEEAGLLEAILNAETAQGTALGQALMSLMTGAAK